jgi:hypothetical protein
MLLNYDRSETNVWKKRKSSLEVWSLVKPTKLADFLTCSYHGMFADGTENRSMHRLSVEQSAAEG